MEIASVALVALGAYLLGSIPSGYLLGRARGVDLRKAGSGNIGATNALRVLGKPAGYACFAFDAGKGLAAVLLARGFAAPALGIDGETAAVAAAVAAIVGHNFPVWLGFSGGKGIATSAGAIAALFPWVIFAVALGVWLALFFGVRIVSVASIGAALAIGGGAAFLWARGEIGAAAGIAGIVMCVLAVARHRSNIARLLAGTEPRFGKKPDA